MTSNSINPHFKIKPPPPKNKHHGFVSAFVKSIHEDFFFKATQILIEKSVFFDNVQKSPFEFRHPEESSKLLDVSLNESGSSHEDLLKILESICRFSPHSSHPYYLDKLSSGLDPYAIAADWLGSTMTTPLALYLISPVFTLMEVEIVKKLGSLIGFSECGGVTTPGSGIANAMALNCAMQSKFPTFKTNGFPSLGTVKPIIFLSEHASSSFEKAGILGGFPSESLVWIEVDTFGKMSIEHLKAAIKTVKTDPANQPVIIIGTAGTPVLGAVDSLGDIAIICRREGCWFHVDADLGGGALLSSNQIHRLQGIEKADSVTFGSWMLALPKTTSFLLTKEADVLQSTFEYQATYLYTGNDIYDTKQDRGDCTLQTSRRPDVLKFWYSWRSRGKSGLSSHIDKCYQNAEAFVELLKSRSGFVILTDAVDIPQVSFQYIPVGLQKMPKSAQFQTRINKFTERLQDCLLLSGVMQISVSSLSNSKFLTVSFCNSVLETHDLKYILDQIESFGERLDIPFLNHDTDPLKTISPNWIIESIIQPPMKVSSNTEDRPWATAAQPSKDKQFLEDVIALFLKTGIFYEERRKEPALRFRKPEDLRKLYDFKLRDLPLTHEQILKDMETVIYYSLHPGHLYFMYQLLSGQDPYTLIADYFISTLNTPMITYEDSPVFTLMDNEILAEIRNRVFGTKVGDGLVTDGGSMSNQISVSLALQKRFSGISMQGVSSFGMNFKLFVSEDGHFSFSKGAVLKGLGSESCVYIKTDALGKMMVKDLINKIEGCLQDGDVPFMVVATTGTTVYGSIDPVPEITEVCQKYNLWCHVDACFGGPVILSDNHSHLLKGIEKADSVAINLHKLLASTLTTSLLISRHEDIMKTTFGSCNDTKEVGQKLLYDRKWDNGVDRHIQNARRNNLFKFWFLWKAKGREGLGKHVDKIFKNAKYATESIKTRPGFVSLLEKFELTNVCFYYIPKSLRSLDMDSLEFRNQFFRVSFDIEKLLIKHEIMSIVTQRRATGNSHVFFKLVLMNSALMFEDIEYILNQIEFFGEMSDKSI